MDGGCGRKRCGEFYMRSILHFVWAHVFGFYHSHMEEGSARGHGWVVYKCNDCPRFVEDEK